MNILFLDSIENETYGGMEEWIRLVAIGLTEKGHKTTVGGRIDSEFLQRIKNSTEAVKLLPLNISGDFNPFTINKLKKYIASESIDIIVANFNKDVRLGGLAGRLFREVKIIWSVGLDITKNSFIHKYLTPKLVDGVIVPSIALKEQIIRFGYIKDEIVEVIPIGIPELENSVDKNKAKGDLLNRYKLPPDTIISVTSGRFVNQKGHRYLVEAAPEIIDNFPNVKFLLLGDGPLKNDLTTQMNTLGVRNNFVFAGMLNNLDLELFGADFMIHPSIEEPFGIAILEGMRAGLPVIAGKVGGIPEVVEENETAILVKPKNRSELAEAVISLLQSPNRLSIMGQKSVTRWRNHFLLVSMIDKIESYMKNTIG